MFDWKWLGSNVDVQGPMVETSALGRGSVKHKLGGWRRGLPLQARLRGGAHGDNST